MNRNGSGQTHGMDIIRQKQLIESTREKKQQERIRSLEDQLAYAEQTHEQLRIQYFNGMSDYINVHTALNEEQRLRRDLLLGGAVVALIFYTEPTTVREGVARETAMLVQVTGVEQGSFRPIILTTVTTFGGLTPIILETSRQAYYLIPMAISLGFGIVFAMAIILVIVRLSMMLVDMALLLTGQRLKSSEPVGQE